MSTYTYETPPTLYNNGDTAWVMTGGALVVVMTFGLAIFYASLTHPKTVASTLIHTIITLGLVSVQWVLFGYSFAFSTDSSNFFGTFQWGGLNGLGTWSNEILAREAYQGTIPGVVFCFFQLTFACITCSIFGGAVVGKMNFSAFLIFVAMWTTIVYDTVAHWEWSTTGWLHTLGSLDFAGGSVVHISSGFTALAMTIVLSMGQKKNRRKAINDKATDEQDEVTEPRHEPIHPIQAPQPDPALNIVGGGLLWFGWFGFNGGSALSASFVAGIAMINTQVCTGSCMFFWAVIELIVTKVRTGKASVSLDGPMYGAVCALVVITPACGYVEPGYAVIIGCYTAIFSFIILVVWKRVIRLAHWMDDSLFVFVSHGVGGCIGSFTTGLFSSLAVNPGGANGAFYGRPIQLAYQLADIGAVAGWSFFVSLILMLLLKFTIGVNQEEEEEQTEGELGESLDPDRPHRKLKKQPTISELTDLLSGTSPSD